MQREITQRELRNESGAIMRALDAGESFIVTRNSVPVAEMTPARRPRFTSKADVVKAFANAPSIDAKRFFSDVDAILDQDPMPRGGLRGVLRQPRDNHRDVLTGNDVAEAIALAHRYEAHVTVNADGAEPNDSIPPRNRSYDRGNCTS
jgi:antitoxin (DNA-binding transcriptional repressor) of toxin-antitoxin stability system